jgi:hypothetical protein
MVIPPEMVGPISNRKEIKCHEKMDQMSMKIFFPLIDDGGKNLLEVGKKCKAFYAMYQENISVWRENVFRPQVVETFIMILFDGINLSLFQILIWAGWVLLQSGSLGSFKMISGAA